MTSENDLIQKLMISKQIMEKHNQTPRGGLPSMDTYNTPEVATYNAPPATYNLPQDMLQEASVPVQTVSQPMTQDRVMASKLPDEIKRLMIEHPIAQPAGMGGPTLSNDLIDKAAAAFEIGLATAVAIVAAQKEPPPLNAILTALIAHNSKIKM